MSLNNNFPTVPRSVAADVPFLTKVMQSLNFAMYGKLNCTGTVTFTANAGSTAVTDNRCLANSVILLQPTTANASAGLATAYITAAAGSFTISHANNAQTDRIFNYVIIG